MNAHARYTHRGPYEPIHQNMVFIRGGVAPIGNTAAKPQGGLPGYQGRASSGRTRFDAQANLASVLSNLRASIPSDPDTIAAAQSAVERMRHRLDEEDVDEWSSSLSSDLAAMRD